MIPLNEVSLIVNPQTQRVEHWLPGAERGRNELLFKGYMLSVTRGG